MKPSEQGRFNELYRCHLRALKLQGMSDKTIDVRRVTLFTHQSQVVEQSSNRKGHCTRFHYGRAPFREQ